jgi:hypothetical protein
MTGWVGSTRRARLPDDWPARVQAVKARAHGRCQATRHEPGCDGIGRECDHVKHGDDHSLANLQWLSTPCHKAKTTAEQPRRLRPARAHP